MVKAFIEVWDDTIDVVLETSQPEVLAEFTIGQRKRAEQMVQRINQFFAALAAEQHDAQR